MTNGHKISIAVTLIAVLVFAASAVIAQDDGDVFSQEITPLTTIDCARCHVQAFTSLRDNGGAHKMDCSECHEQFHVTKKDITWEEQVPACANCHEQPHGDAADMLDCLNCHSDAHAPIASLELDKLESVCARCHAEPANQMTHPSAHSDMGCTDCHLDKHGYLPKCTECHEEPHSTFESSKTCMQCHPVHDVSKQLYSDDIPNEQCAGCHDDQNKQLKQGHLAHAKLNCTFCHANEHGTVPSCEDCHATPHPAEMTKDFDGCSSCHGNAHALLPGE